jgi:hypothetical protein
MMAEYGVLAVTLSKRQSAVLVAPDGTRIAVILPNEKTNGKTQLVLRVDRQIKVIREKHEPTETTT